MPRKRPQTRTDSSVLSKSGELLRGALLSFIGGQRDYCSELQCSPEVWSEDTGSV